jgi:hypothetical protein
MAEFSRNARAIHPDEIKQPGDFIPRPQDPTDQQRVVLAEVHQMLGDAGLYGFEVDPEEEVALLPYDPEQQGSLGTLWYNEVIRYFCPPGLAVDRGYGELWRRFRGTSARIQRDERRWQAFAPLVDEKKVAEAALAEASDLEASSQLRDRIHEIRRQMDRFRHGKSSYPSDPKFKPFIYVGGESAPQPLTPEQNSRRGPISIPHEATMLHLDGLYHNFVSVPPVGVGYIDAHTKRLLTSLLNDRVKAGAS